MNELITYTVFHTETDKVVASGLSKEVLLNLIERMVYEKIVTNIFLPAYVESKITPKDTVDIDRLIEDIESQGVLYFRHTWHVG
ncbi:terminal repeat-encoded protein [Staphylococcus phage vB_SsapH-Golestan-105-M]|nr:terminal repeat-encoded protein [Staphylococcus phage vB_SsapH-Golestan-105-M]